jgi:hypothetical protein
MINFSRKPLFRLRAFDDVLFLLTLFVPLSLLLDGALAWSALVPA